MKHFLTNLLLCLCISCIFIYNNCLAQTYKVDKSGSGDYTTIQEAIFDVPEGGTVKVAPGIYEEALVIEKSFNLIGSGPNFTYIKPQSQDENAITLKKENIAVKIIGLSLTSDQDGIYIDNYNNIQCIISNCIINECINGINKETTADYLNLSISNNTIISCNIGINIDNRNYYNDGVQYRYGPMSIKGNIIAFNENGIKFYNQHTYTIKYNNLYKNTVNYEGCSTTEGDISVSPKFINQELNNFVLASDSLCINAGTFGKTYMDPDGTRNDIGAFGGPDAAAFWPYYPNGPIVNELSVIPTAIPKGGKLSIKAVGRIRD